MKNQKELTKLLNDYRNAYYNENKSLVSDKEYDALFDTLKRMEEESGVIFANSPTQNVGYKVKSELKKVKHNHPMLSLGKTKSENEIVNFFSKDGVDREVIGMLKMDGLTCSLKYENGELVSAETRGNGEIGEDILHNALVVYNIPKTIKTKETLVVDGEIIITQEDFEILKKENPEFKNSRNVASGSIRQLDSRIASKRRLSFVAWRMVSYGKKTLPDAFANNLLSNNFANNLFTLDCLGFTVTPYIVFYNNKSYLSSVIKKLKKIADDYGYPIDGLVFGFNDIAYGESLGMTSHHPNNQIAFKFYDEEVTTTLEDIEINMGKTGVLTPVAIFSPVEIDGTTVTRASLHNISMVEDLDLCIGDEITVYKANQIIPQVKENLDYLKENRTPVMVELKDRFSHCPFCESKTEIRKDNNTKFLYCTNDKCNEKMLQYLSNYVSRNAMNIVGLSEETLFTLLQHNKINSVKDIYSIKDYKDELVKIDGLGTRSVSKMLQSIEDSKNTTLDRFLFAISIPLIGKSKAKIIANYLIANYKENASFKTFVDIVKSGFDLSVLQDIGEEIDKKIKEWLNSPTNETLINDIIYIEENYLVYPKEVKEVGDKLNGMTFVITGSLNVFSNRNEAKERIEQLGGKVSGSVSSKTSYLVNNDIESNSSKNKKAKELGVSIITENELLSMLE